MLGAICSKKCCWGPMTDPVALYASTRSLPLQKPCVSSGRRQSRCPSGPAQPCNGSRRHRQGSSLRCEELAKQFRRWNGAIFKKQIVVLDTSVQKCRPVVARGVQTDDRLYAQSLEDLGVILCRQRMQIALHRAPCIVRSTERQKLVRHDPVPITILYPLIKFITLYVELLQLEKTTPHSLVQSFQAVQH